jgi:hypothetical protein
MLVLSFGGKVVILATKVQRFLSIFVQFLSSTVCIKKYLLFEKERARGKLEKRVRSLSSSLERAHYVENYKNNVGISTNIESSAFKFVTTRVLLFRKTLSLSANFFLIT